MSVVSLSPEEFERAKSLRGITRLLSPVPAFNMHSPSSPERELIETYIFDQFKSNHDAIVHDFMPLFLSTSCNGRYSAVTGIRPALGRDLFLEQYLPEAADKILGRLAGRQVERKDFVEIGNLASTQRGSSQLLFLILAAVLQRAGYEWLVFTATPQVNKTIKRLGFKLYDIGYADRSVLDADALENWGSYYECRPGIVAGNLSEGLKVLTSKKIYSHIIALYHTRIDALALQMKQNGDGDAKHTFTA